MAKYRQIYTEFWSDSFVLELTPEEKFFYLYLLTNTKSTQSGLYEISQKFISIETGYDIVIVNQLLKKFCEYKKILYCETTKEIMVLNWIKYNIPNNINAIIGVQKELLKVKNKVFLKIFYEKCKAAKLEVDKIFKDLLVDEIIVSDSFPEKLSSDNILYENSNSENLDKLSINAIYVNSADVISIKSENVEDKSNTTNTMEAINELSKGTIIKPIDSHLLGAIKPLPSNRIRIKEEEVINKEQGIKSKEQRVINKEEEVVSFKERVITKEEVVAKVNTTTKETVTIKAENASADGLKTIIKIFEENVHAITPLVYQKILDFTKHVSDKVIIMAITEAVNYNAKTIKYIAKVLNCWISKGIKTAEQVIAYQEQWTNNNSATHNVKSSNFCDYPQRTYDFDLLEKQLLGIA